MSEGRPRLLLAVCGHSSARHTSALVQRLQAVGDVRVVATPRARTLLEGAGLDALGDTDEWYRWQKVSPASPRVSARGS